MDLCSFPGIWAPLGWLAELFIALADPPSFLYLLAHWSLLWVLYLHPLSLFCCFLVCFQYSWDRLARLLWLVCVFYDLLSRVPRAYFCWLRRCSLSSPYKCSLYLFHESIATSLLPISHPFSPLWVFCTEWSLAWSSFLLKFLISKWTASSSLLILTDSCFYSSLNRINIFVKASSTEMPSITKNVMRGGAILFVTGCLMLVEIHVSFFCLERFRFPLSPSLLQFLVRLLKLWPPHHGYRQLLLLRNYLNPACR